MTEYCKDCKLGCEESMNRKMTLLVFAKVANKLAKQNNFTQITECSSDCGLWDQKSFTGWEKTMTELITEKYGKLKETRFTADGTDASDPWNNPRVEISYRFKNPQIEYGCQNSDDGFACIEYGEKSNSEDYEMKQITIFGEKGVVKARILRRMIRDAMKELGVKE